MPYAGIIKSSASDTGNTCRDRDAVQRSAFPESFFFYDFDVIRNVVMPTMICILNIFN